MSKEIKVKILADWKDQKNIDINDILKEIAKELEYKNTFEGAVEELKLSLQSSFAPLADALAGLAKAINKTLPDSDEAAAALARAYKDLNSNTFSWCNQSANAYSHAEGYQNWAYGYQGNIIPQQTELRPETSEETEKPKENNLLEFSDVDDWYDNFLKDI